MCGISGCLANDGGAMITVVSALSKLQNRGYDSAGIGTIINGECCIKKSLTNNEKNAIKEIKSNALSITTTNLAIGHTRWATHGPKSLENTHPHTDNDQQLMLVHNGIIENYQELYDELISYGYTFYGQTDTEIITKYLHLLKERGNGIEELNKKMRGSWAILVVDRSEPNKIYFLKNESPLIIGINQVKTKAMFVSELVGFTSDIVEYMILPDQITGNMILDDLVKITSSQPLESNPFEALFSEDSPFPYSHWMLREINDQSSTTERIIKERLHGTELHFPELDKIQDKLHGVDHYIFLACGTSYHAAQVGSRFFKEFRTPSTVEVIDGADFEEIDIIPGKKTVLILLSQSGETKDVYRALCLGKQHQLLSIGIINVENSLIARESDCCLYLKTGYEHAVASTKSFTNQVLMLLLVAMWMNPLNLQTRDKYYSAIKNFPSDIQKIIDKSIVEIPQLIPYFKDQQSCFVLGKNLSEWIASEGSLKIKEISYIHSEGYSTAALKHGPFALLTDNIPVIILANNDSSFSKIENVTSEIKSRYAKVIYITNKSGLINNVDYSFCFDSDSTLFPILSVIPLQLLSFYLALDRGNNPDYPRNLAKVVTVE